MAVPRNPILATPKAGIEQVIRDYALSRAKQVNEQDVMAALKEEGITDLHSLVQKSLAGIRQPGGSVARTTFIYEQFVYKESLTLPEKALEDFKTRLRVG